VAVWGGSEADAGSLADALASCPTLRSWAAGRSITLDGTPGARWHVWPNGHPVIRLVSGRDLDVVAVVSHRMRAGSRELGVVYRQEAGTAPGLG
jgi:hypothetical protein